KVLGSKSEERTRVQRANHTKGSIFFSSRD
ncbi:unnamed protein product, partial [marine sediment metagenome]